MASDTIAPAALTTAVVARRGAALERWLERPWFFTLWCVLASFGSYACMYGFRKPFTAASYSGTEFGPHLKTWLVTAQVVGYTLSKFVGIKVIAEMNPARRATAILGLVAAAQLALLLFAFTPPPFNAFWLFLNGLPLGLVYGLVLGFLEGRRMTELFIAGLCASFILADGATKSVGAWLLQSGVAERWMPFSAGLIFLGPLAVFVWMLRRIPKPTGLDVAARSARAPMNRGERLAMLQRHGIGLALIVFAFLLITVLRSVRADFAPEIWSGLGVTSQPSVFALSETWVAVGAAAASGLVVLVRDNRRAFFLALTLSAGALGVAALSLIGQRAGLLSPFAFMVLLGIGMYVPYVCVHTTIFERLLALTRESGNIGFLMYLADAAGYIGYTAVMLGRSAFPERGDFLTFFIGLSGWLVMGAMVILILAGFLYARLRQRPPAAV